MNLKRQIQSSVLGLRWLLSICIVDDYLWAIQYTQYVCRMHYNVISDVGQMDMPLNVWIKQMFYWYYMMVCHDSTDILWLGTFFLLACICYGYIIILKRIRCMSLPSLWFQLMLCLHTLHHFLLLLLLLQKLWDKLFVHFLDFHGRGINGGLRPLDWMKQETRWKKRWNPIIPECILLLHLMPSFGINSKCDDETQWHTENWYKIRAIEMATQSIHFLWWFDHANRESKFQMNQMQCLLFFTSMNDDQKTIVPFQWNSNCGTFI